MAYSPKVMDHYDNPRNVGTLDKNDENVGTGLVGAPACGDVMRLQVRIEEKIVGVRCLECGAVTPCLPEPPADLAQACGHARYETVRADVIADAKFKTFGCGSAIASSSLVTEWVKGMSPDDALAITNAQVAQELSLPPVKIHCSVLAEDAVKAAIADFKKKREARKAAAAAPSAEPPAPLPPEYPASPVAEDGHGTAPDASNPSDPSVGPGRPDVTGDPDGR